MKTEETKKVRVSFATSEQARRRLKMESVITGETIDSILKTLLDKHLEELDDEFDRQCYLDAKREYKGQPTQPWQEIRKELVLDTYHVQG